MFRLVLRAAALAALAIAVWSIAFPRLASAQIVNAAAPVLSLALIILAAAVFVLRRAKPGIAFIVAAGILIWPPLTAWLRSERVDLAGGHVAGTPLRVVSFNAFHANPEGEAAARRLVALGGDVLILQEADGLGEAGLALVRRRYPHTGTCRDNCDLAIFSRLPMDRPRWKFRDATGSPVGARLVQAVVRPEGQAPFTVVSAHLMRPYRDPLRARTELAELAQTIGRWAGPDAILAGDFNRAPWSPEMADFEASIGLRRAPSFAGTWPAQASLAGLALPALVPIDHVFAGPEWLFRKTRAATLPGSDHRAMIVDLVRVRPPVPAAPASPPGGAPAHGRPR